MMLTAMALAMAPAAAEAPQQGIENAKTELAVAALANGQSDRAIRKLEQQLAESPSDPALLINLGIAFAQQGDKSKARAMFKAAMDSPEQFDLETADGSATDSRRLARKAMAMLDRGEFTGRTQLTMREK